MIQTAVLLWNIEGCAKVICIGHQSKKGIILREGNTSKSELS